MGVMRRLIVWTFCLGFLAGVGLVVFFYARYAPRCTITGPLVVQHVSADGGRLATLGPLAMVGPMRNYVCHKGPLQHWDTRSGRVVQEWFEGADVRRCNHSPDGRHAAVVLGDGVLRIVDGHTGKEWRFDEQPKDEAVNRCDFSHGGRWLLVVTARCDTLYVIDVHACQVVLRMRDNWPIISNDDTLIYYREGKDRAVTVWNLHEGKARGVVPVTSIHFGLSADGRLLLERHVEPFPLLQEEAGDGDRRGGGVRKIEHKDYRVAVWDVATGRRLFQHEMSRRGDLQAVLSPTAASWPCGTATKTRRRRSKCSTP